MIQGEKRKYTKVQVFIVDMKILEYNRIVCAPGKYMTRIIITIPTIDHTSKLFRYIYDCDDTSCQKYPQLQKVTIKTKR